MSSRIYETEYVCADYYVLLLLLLTTKNTSECKALHTCSTLTLRRIPPCCKPIKRHFTNKMILLRMNAY